MPWREREGDERPKLWITKDSVKRFLSLERNWFIERRKEVGNKIYELLISHKEEILHAEVGYFWNERFRKKVVDDQRKRYLASEEGSRGRVVTGFVQEDLNGDLAFDIIFQNANPKLPDDISFVHIGWYASEYIFDLLSPEDRICVECEIVRSSLEWIKRYERLIKNQKDQLGITSQEIPDWI